MEIEETVKQANQNFYDAFNKKDLSLMDSVEIIANRDFAWVSCQENLFSIHSRGVQTSKVYATNLFHKFGGQWKMIQHHASALPGVE